MKRVLTITAVLFMLGAAPATQPASRPGEQYPALQKRLAELQAELDEARAINQKLAGENADLREKLKGLEPKPPADAKEPRSTITTPEELKAALVSRIHVGQSRAEVESVFGKPSDETREGEFVVREYSRYWKGHTNAQTGKLEGYGRFTVKCWYRENQLADVRSYTADY
jgi:hypothetical protein